MGSGEGRCNSLDMLTPVWGIVNRIQIKHEGGTERRELDAGRNAMLHLTLHAFTIAPIKHSLPTLVGCTAEKPTICLQPSSSDLQSYCCSLVRMRILFTCHIRESYHTAVLNHVAYSFANYDRPLVPGNSCPADQLHKSLLQSP